MTTRFSVTLLAGMILSAWTGTAHAGHGCPLDHFAIGQSGGEGSHTGRLFADVTELYLTHLEKPYASHYSLNYSAYYNAYRNGEPGSEEVENDSEHGLAGERLVDFDLWLEIVDISTNGLWVGYGGNWYNAAGGRFHLSGEAWHHLHLTYHVYAADWSADELIYVVYRVVDDLDDGEQYDASDDFWVVLNREVPGDFNRNAHIDLADYAHLQIGFTGAGIPQSDPAYQDADLDGDDDVDPDDFTRFEGCLRGPAQYADPRCAD